MTKPRKRKATKGPQPKQAAKKSAKRSTSRRRPVTSSDDDVFIPRRLETSSTSVRVAALEQPAGDAHDDVFVARAGAPVVVQADWIDDSAANAGGVSTDEWFASWEPRALTAGGWTEEQLREHGLIAKDVGRVVCRYGCDGSTSNVPGVSQHHYSCPYWQREGREKTPF